MQDMGKISPSWYEDPAYWDDDLDDEYKDPAYWDDDLDEEECDETETDDI